MDETPLVVQRVEDGQKIPVHVCTCFHCDNEWYVPGLSEEWMPSYCCFCGTKFLGRRYDGEERDFRPKSD